jgi:hypothetical protein
MLLRLMVPFRMVGWRDQVSKKTDVVENSRVVVGSEVLSLEVYAVVKPVTHLRFRGGDDQSNNSNRDMTCKDSHRQTQELISARQV